MANAKILDVVDFRIKTRRSAHPLSKIIRKNGYRSRAKSDLPFRVKFINIGIESYGPNNTPPIGIAVIGFNNYIL